MCIYYLFVYLSKGGSNSQDLMLALHKENTATRENKCQVILLSFMLSSLVNLFSFAPGLYMVVLSDMICQIFQYAIQQQHDEIFWYLC